METRLAQVQALVQQRWERAREKQRQNSVLARRKQALVDELTVLISSTRSVNEAEAGELEARILKREREVDERRRSIALRCREVMRWRSRRLALDAQIKHLQNAIEMERKKNTRFFDQVASDKLALEKIDKERRDKERIQLEERRRALLHEHDGIQEEVAAAQSKVRDNGNAVRALEEERRVLERELREATQLSASLKKRVDAERQQMRKIAELTRKQVAQTLEERANCILKELDDLGA